MGTKSCLRRTSVTYAQDALAFHESPPPLADVEPDGSQARTGAHPVLDGQFADDFSPLVPRLHPSIRSHEGSQRSLPRFVPLSRTAGPDQVSPKRAHAWRHLNVQPGEWAGVASAGTDRLPHSATLRQSFLYEVMPFGHPRRGAHWKPASAITPATQAGSLGQAAAARTSPLCSPRVMTRPAQRGLTGGPEPGAAAARLSAPSSPPLGREPHGRGSRPRPAASSSWPARRGAIGSEEEAAGDEDQPHDGAADNAGG